MTAKPPLTAAHFGRIKQARKDWARPHDEAKVERIQKIGSKTPNPTRALANITSAMWSEAEEECDRLAEALRLILPLAKGYAAANDVGSNQEYVRAAEAVLTAFDAAGMPDPSP
jgi:hypothetical protein